MVVAKRDSAARWTLSIDDTTLPFPDGSVEHAWRHWKHDSYIFTEEMVNYILCSLVLITFYIECGNIDRLVSDNA